jgi:hypothetical protein
MLEGKAVPSIVQRTLIRPPSSRLGPLKDEERAALIAASPLAGFYDEAVDRESAFEVLKARANGVQQQHEPAAAPRTTRDSPGFSVPDFGWGRSRESAPAPEARYDEPARRPRLDEYESGAERRRREASEERANRRDTYGYGGRQTVAEAAIKSVVRSVSSQVGSQLGRALIRGVLGSLLK